MENSNAKTVGFSEFATWMSQAINDQGDWHKRVTQKATPSELEAWRIGAQWAAQTALNTLSLQGMVEIDYAK